MNLLSISVQNLKTKSGIIFFYVFFLPLFSFFFTCGDIGAQTDFPGNPVIIPGREIAEWGQVAEISGSFGKPSGAAKNTPAVLILHGSGGIDARGAFYAKALQEAGIAALEIEMFPPWGRPKTGTRANMPHAAAALKWLSEQPTIKGQRIGVMGFSWGGVMSVMISSEDVQERLGIDVPKPSALVSFYPVCTTLSRAFQNPKHYYYNFNKRMSAIPMLIFIGTKDDYEEGERTCDALIEMWPTTAREKVTIRYVEGATHGFDSPIYREIYDEYARGGRGGDVKIIPSQKDSAESRDEVVKFFLKNLKP
jgi:dienelactone hydrolase